jgi:hypothetical protein
VAKKKKRRGASQTNSQKKPSDKFAHTMVIPDAPTQELNIHSLFADMPEEDAEATRKQRRRPSGSTGASTASNRRNSSTKK